MSIEIWILLLVTVALVSAWGGYLYARRGAPSTADLEALEQQLEEARSQSESVQSSVNEHFEQSAILFGKLAGDYRDFLEHFSESAQALGLSETRARELLEQGYQPLLTHDSEAQGQAQADVVASEGESSRLDPAAVAAVDAGIAQPEPSGEPEATAQGEPAAVSTDSEQAAQPVVTDVDITTEIAPDGSDSTRIAGVSVDLEPAVEEDSEDRRQAS